MWRGARIRVGQHWMKKALFTLVNIQPESTSLAGQFSGSSKFCVTRAGWSVGRWDQRAWGKSDLANLRWAPGNVSVGRGQRREQQVGEFEFFGVAGRPGPRLCCSIQEFLQLSGPHLPALADGTTVAQRAPDQRPDGVPGVGADAARGRVGHDGDICVRVVGGVGLDVERRFRRPASSIWIIDAVMLRAWPFARLRRQPPRRRFCRCVQDAEVAAQVRFGARQRSDGNVTSGRWFPGPNAASTLSLAGVRTASLDTIVTSDDDVACVTPAAKASATSG